MRSVPVSPERRTRSGRRFDPEWRIGLNAVVRVGIGPAYLPTPVERDPDARGDFLRFRHQYESDAGCLEAFLEPLVLKPRASLPLLDYGSRLVHPYDGRIDSGKVMILARVRVLSS